MTTTPNAHEPRPQPVDEFLTITELADYLKVPEKTVRSWRQDHTGPRGVRLGKHVRFRRVDVDDWIAARSRDQHRDDRDGADDV